MNLESTPKLAFIIDALKKQQIIAYPTETVFALGCDPDSELAVSNLLSLKHRSKEKGLILIASDYQQLIPYINDNALNDQQRAAMFSTWPGAVTWVIPALPKTPRFLTGRFNSLAVRVTPHPIVQQLCMQYGKPLVSTSANLSNQNPCRNKDEVAKYFGTSLPVLDGKAGIYAEPSEIRNALSGKRIR